MPFALCLGESEHDEDMSLEYAIEYPCALRARDGEARLRELARLGALVSRVVTATLATDAPPAPESVAFTARYAEELERLEGITNYCQHCPACVESTGILAAPEPVGCLGRIRYPIAAAFEKFLANRVQRICATRARQEWPRLLQVLTSPDSPFDGEATKALRAVTTPEGLRFFALRVPIPLVCGTRLLTTDHLFDLFAGFSAAEADAQVYQRELPAIALADYDEFLTSVLATDVAERELESSQADVQTYQEFVRLQQTIAQAAKLDARLMLD